MSNESSNKRRRKDDKTKGGASSTSTAPHPSAHDGAHQPDDFTRSPEFWFSDGTLILVCESTGFRVHTGVLALHCEVFKDMTSIGNPTGDQLVDGAFVVRLDDTADDMASFLRCLYFRKEGPMRARLQVRQLGSLLRLARKYVADSLQEEVMEHLTILFPSTLKVYRSSQRDSLLPSLFNPLEAVSLALDLDIPTMLPAALYSSALCDPAKCDFYEETTTRVMRAIMVFRERHAHNVLRMAIDWYWFDTHNDCWTKTEPGCQNMTKGIALAMVEHYRALNFDIFKCKFTDDLADAFWENNVLCQHCAEELEPDRLASDLWTDLPKFCVDTDWKAWEDVEAQK